MILLTLRYYLVILKNPLESHKKRLPLQPIFQSKRFHIFPSLLGGSEGLDAFIFFFNPEGDNCHNNNVVDMQSASLLLGKRESR